MRSRAVVALALLALAACATPPRETVSASALVAAHGAAAAGASFDELRRALEAQAAAAGDAGPPAEFVPGLVREDVRARAEPDRRAREIEDVPSGEAVWMAPRPSAGWRRIWRPGIRECWLEEWMLEPLPGPAVTPGRASAR